MPDIGVGVESETGTGTELETDAETGTAWLHPGCDTGRRQVGHEGGGRRLGVLRGLGAGGEA